MSSSRREISILDNYEQMALLKQPNPRAPTGLRNLCIISLMLKIGLRVNEAVNLMNSDINWEEGRIRIAASGAAKERTLYLDKPELSLLKKWHEQKPSGCDFFFCTLEGSKLQDRYIREMIKRLAQKAGLEKDVYPHLLRYTFAVEFIRETGDVTVLQEALGHRDAAATQNYVKHMFVNDNYSSNGGKVNKRSGSPVSERKPGTEQTDTRQNSFPYESKKNNIGYTVSKHPQKSTNKRSEELQVNEVGEKESVKQDKPVKQKKPVKHLEKPGPNDSNDFTPRIAIEEDRPEPNARIPIPSIKCSSCNYILRYKGDCPKCGVSFEKIVDYWRRFV